jgi:hypothetical protein
MPRTMADVLVGLIESGLLPDQSGKEPQITDVASDPPVPPGTPWVDPNRIRAVNARDVLERVDDDRSRAERWEQASRAFAVAKLSRPPRFTFGVHVKAKAKRPKVARTAEVREYFRQYMRERRPRQKASTVEV